MTGAVIVVTAVITVVVLGTYLIQAALIAIEVAWVLAVVAAQVGITLLCGVVWLGWFVVHPREALASLRDAIARAEAESAIRRLNA